MKWILPLLLLIASNSSFSGELIDRLLLVEGPILQKVDFEVDANLGGAAEIGASKEFVIRYNKFLSFRNVSKKFKGQLFQSSFLTSLEDESINISIVEEDEYRGVGNIDVFFIVYSDLVLENDTYVNENFSTSEASLQKEYDFYGDKLSIKVNLEQLDAVEVINEFKKVAKECKYSVSFRSLSLHNFGSTKPWEKSHFACAQVGVIMNALEKNGFSKDEIQSIYKEYRAL